MYYLLNPKTTIAFNKMSKVVGTVWSSVYKRNLFSNGSKKQNKALVDSIAYEVNFLLEKEMDFSVSVIIPRNRYVKKP